jgi:hypothetical protein
VPKADEVLKPLKGVNANKPESGTIPLLLQEKVPEADEVVKTLKGVNAKIRNPATSPFRRRCRRRMRS